MTIGFGRELSGAGRRPARRRRSRGAGYVGAPRRYVIPALCIAEVAFILGRRAGPEIESRFLESMKDWDVRAPRFEEWPRISELVRTYADLPLGRTDASVVSLAETLETSLVVTLDKRHFGIARPAHVERLTLLPE